MDLNYGPSPSTRPAPQPYDDPYSDAYNQPGTSSNVATSSLASHPSHSERGPGEHPVRGNRGRGRGRDDHRPPYHRDRGRGRGRGHGHGGHNHGHGRGRGRGRGAPRGQAGHPHRAGEQGAHGPRPLSPPSAQAVPNSPTQPEYPSTGGSADYTPYSPQLQQQFGFAQSYPSVPQPYVSPQVQPHINPRFAEQFGLSLDMMPQQPYYPYNQYAPVYDSGAEGSWDGQWSRCYGAGEDPQPGQNSQGS
jgi:H/ACA ribonucleoprotein complex non-core subunit NAF1